MEPNLQGLMAPSKVDEITPVWLSEVTGLKIDPNHFTLNSNIHQGTGYLSNLVRVTCSTIEADDEVKSHHFIIKLLPESELRDWMINEGLDKNEILSYKRILPELVKQVPSLAQNFCNFIYGYYPSEDEGEGSKYVSVIVLEDLKAQGYTLVPFEEIMSLEQVEEGVKFLAKFNFGGCMVEEVNDGKSIPELFSFIKGLESFKLDQLTEFIFGGLTILKEHVLGGEGFEELRGLCSNLTLSKKIIEKTFEAGKEFPSLSHGDFWANNLLFDPSGLKPVKVIDWQLMGYMDPAFDLSVLLLSCLPKNDLTKENLDHVLSLYYDTFQKLCLEQNCENLIKRDLTQFSEFFYSFGITYALIWFTVSLVSIENGIFSGDMEKLIGIYKFILVDAQGLQLMNEIESS